MYTFIGHENWTHIFPSDSDIVDLGVSLNDKKVTVLRPILFFHAEQKTTLSKISAYFTQHAIAKLVHDKFIEIND